MKKCVKLLTGIVAGGALMFGLAACDSAGPSATDPEPSASQTPTDPHCKAAGTTVNIGDGRGEPIASPKALTSGLQATDAGRADFEAADYNVNEIIVGWKDAGHTVPDNDSLEDVALVVIPEKGTCEVQRLEGGALDKDGSVDPSWDVFSYVAPDAPAQDEAEEAYVVFEDPRDPGFLISADVWYYRGVAPDAARGLLLASGTLPE